MKPKSGKIQIILSTRIHWLSWILSMFSIVLAIVAAVLVALDADNKQENAAINSQETKAMTCLDCLSNFEKLMSEPENNQNCCELKPGDIESAFEKITLANSERDIEEYKDSRNLTSVSAHIYLLGFDKDQQIDSLNQVIVPLNENLSDDKYNSHARGVKIGNKEIKILISGVYYVYSSITYQPYRSKAKESSTYQTWYHFVNQRHGHHQKTSTSLLRSVFTHCPDCSNGEDSVYTGGIFHLKAGDLIILSISGQGVLGQDIIKKSSFLGLYMLANF